MSCQIDKVFVSINVCCCGSVITYCISNGIKVSLDVKNIIFCLAFQTFMFCVNNEKFALVRLFRYNPFIFIEYKNSKPLKNFCFEVIENFSTEEIYKSAMWWLSTLLLLRNFNYIHETFDVKVHYMADINLNLWLQRLRYIAFYFAQS